MRFLIALLLVGVVVPAASAQTSGTYKVRGGHYTITVEAHPGMLVVVEPNKRSEYTEVRPGVYRMYNERTQAAYFMGVVDGQTLEAWRDPASGGPNTFLELTGSATGTPASPDHARHMAIAEHYAGLARTDPTNTQAWTFCSVSALGYANKTTAEANEYARQVASTLKSIATDRSQNPCGDAIPQAIWASAP